MSDISNARLFLAALLLPSLLQAEEFNAHQDPVISGINRLPARASLYSFGKELDFEFTF